MHTEMVVLPAFFGMISFVIWAVMSGWERRNQFKLVNEFNSRLLDRVASMKDFSDFLQTEGGTTLMDTLTAERGTTDARDRILRATQAGVVFIALGVGFLFLGWRHAFSDHEAFTVVGVIALSLGLGFLLSSGASYWLARTLGVLDAGQRRGDRQSAVR